MRSTPLVYLIILGFCFVGAFVFKLRTRGIFACTAEGYSPESYLGYCQAPDYGDYDHGAVWFNLEPVTLERAADADVLFLGNSRMQFAFSNQITREWFASVNASYYLFGFSHSETIRFVGPLVSRLRPRAKMYIINVDRFFSDEITPPAEVILDDGDAAISYKEKQWWQFLHRSLCATVPWMCGNNLAYYRFRENGEWVMHGSAPFQAAKVSDAPSDNVDKWEHFAELGERFVSGLSIDRKCVILTLSPSSETRRSEAISIAGALGTTLVSPDLDGLRTFDGSHLDPPSAEKWVKAFYEAAGQRIRACLDKNVPTRLN